MPEAGLRILLLAGGLRVQHGEPDTFGNLTQNLVRANEILHQTPLVEIERNSELNGVERAQPGVHSVCIDQPLSVSKVPSGHRHSSQYPAAKIPAKPGTQKVNVRDRQLSRTHLPREGRRDFDDGKAGNVQRVVRLGQKRLHDRRSYLNVIEFPDSAGVEEVPRQLQTLLAFSSERGGHGSRNFRQCCTNLFEANLWQFFGSKAGK